MGIKGRKKKLRERLARLQEMEEEKAGALKEQELSSADNDDDAEYMPPTRAPPLHSSGVVVMGDGPFQLPTDAYGNVKLKKSELYKMQDQHYLDAAREAHEQRKTSHLRTSAKRQRQQETREQRDLTEIEDTLLGKDYIVRGAPDSWRKVQGRMAVEDDAAPAAKEPKASAKKKKKREAEVAEAAAAAVEEAPVEVKTKVVQRGARFAHPLMGLDSDVVGALQLEGFERMTVIQERTIPYALEGYDLLGQARTGSGKTLAFCVPILHVVKDAVARQPRTTLALLLAPTKELCVQTYDVLQKLVQHLPQSASCTLQLITGGTKVAEERKALTAGATLVVGTPGRVHDHAMHCKTWALSRLRFLLLDEADRMLADGFRRALDAIIGALPQSRQTFLFSATNTKSVQELARLSLLRTPIFINTTGTAPLPMQQVTGSDDAADSMPTMLSAVSAAAIPPYRSYKENEEGEATAAPLAIPAAPVGAKNKTNPEPARAGTGTGEEEKAVEEMEPIPTTLVQFCHICPYEDRLLSLYVFVKKVARTSKAMVFCSTIASTIFHCQMMASVGFHDHVMMLHGHMKHRQRVQAFRIFQQWKTGVLFCTDVAARGLDIPDLQWILQCDPPLDPTEYIHRIGRTARAGNVGNSLIFLSPHEANFVRYLNKFGIHLQKLPMPAQLPELQETFEHVLQIDPIVAKSAVSAFRAHVGAYQSHILKDIFSMQHLDLDGLAMAFALTSTPNISLPKGGSGADEEEKKQQYVKGKLKSLNRRRLDAIKHYEQQKTKQQWEQGSFVGVARPSWSLK